MHTLMRKLAASALLFGVAAAAPMVHAGGTDAGVDVTNTATLDYDVGGIDQTDVNSNTTTFKVDNLVRVVVDEVDDTHTPVTPGSTEQVVTFTVTNTGNKTQDYQLAFANLATAATLTLGVTNYTDDFDGTGCSVWVEDGTTVGFDSGEDINQSYLENLIKDNDETVYVVCDIPGAATDGQDAIISLTATTADAGTCSTACAITAADGDGDDPLAEEVVFGDIAGTEVADIARDGEHSARDVYRVASAQISVTKTQTVICDPINLTTSPYHIPGAYVRYEITIANAGGAGASATLTTLADALNANTTFDPDLVTGAGATCDATPENAAGNGFRLTCPVARTSCAVDIFYTTAAADDAMEHAAGTVTINFGDVVGLDALPSTDAGYTAGELKPGESVTIRFNAEID